MASVGSLKNGCETIGILRLSQRDMPQSGSRSRVVAKSDESGEPVFTLMDVLLCGLLLYNGQFLNKKKGPRLLV
jgi:hypothetical protein